MKNPRTVVAAAVAALTLLAAAGAQACEGTAGTSTAAGPLTRDQVRAELAEARAAGLLDVPGEAGATDAVLAAREHHNATQALVLMAQQALAQQLASADDAAGEPDLDYYFEAGPHGPVMVLLMFDGDGALYSADTLAVSMAAID